MTVQDARNKVFEAETALAEATKHLDAELHPPQPIYKFANTEKILQHFHGEVTEEYTYFGGEMIEITREDNSTSFHSESAFKAIHDLGFFIGCFGFNKGKLYIRFFNRV